jgi:hypothetical protein
MISWTATSYPKTYHDMMGVGAYAARSQVCSLGLFLAWILCEFPLQHDHFCHRDSTAHYPLQTAFYG